MRRKKEIMNVIVFGNVPLASWVIGELLKSHAFKLIGVVANKCEIDQFSHHGSSLPPAYHYCKEFKIPLLSFEEAGLVAENNDALGISVRYNNIFTKNYFDKFPKGIINLHGGSLPEYRGSNIANFLILNGESKGGGTIHYIAEGIDEGNVVIRKECEISSADTAFTLFKKIMDTLRLAFKEFIYIVECEKPIPNIPQSELISGQGALETYRAKDLEIHREVVFDDFLTGQAQKKIRAFAFPGRESAYIKLADLKVNLVLDYT